MFAGVWSSQRNVPAATNHLTSSFSRSYTTREFAFANKLAYVDTDGTVVMKGDDSTQLAEGIYRYR